MPQHLPLPWSCVLIYQFQIYANNGLDLCFTGEVIWHGQNMVTTLEHGVTLFNRTSLVIAKDGLYAASGSLSSITVALRVTSSTCKHCRRLVRESCEISKHAAGVFRLRAGDRLSLQICWERSLNVPVEKIKTAELRLRLLWAAKSSGWLVPGSFSIECWSLCFVFQKKADLDIPRCAMMFFLFLLPEQTIDSTVMHSSV